VKCHLSLPCYFLYICTLQTWGYIIPCVDTLMKEKPCINMFAFRLVYEHQKYAQNRSWALLATFFILVSCLAYSTTLKMDASRSSTSLVDFQQTAWCYIPEGRTIHNHCCKTSNSYAFLYFMVHWSMLNPSHEFNFSSCNSVILLW
jgi:hypothetical protein